MIEKLLKEHRKLLEDALQWLDEKEPRWQVKVDRKRFLLDLLQHVAQPSC